MHCHVRGNGICLSSQDTQKLDRFRFGDFVLQQMNGHQRQREWKKKRVLQRQTQRMSIPVEIFEVVCCETSGVGAI